jgi:hypothetical protein
MTSLTHVVVMNRWRMVLVAPFVCLAVSMLLASAKVAIRGGFGASDLIPFLVWTIPLSLVGALIRHGLDSLLRLQSAPLTYTLSGVAGIISGVLWTYLVALWLGPYFGAFSFEVLPCWIVGAASALIMTTTYSLGTGRQVSISLAIIAVIGLAGLLGDRPLFHLLTNAQRLELVIVEWTPGSEPLSNPPILGSKLTDADFEQLKSIGLTGQVEVGGPGFYGEGKRGKAIIVISQPVKQSTMLPQPDGGEVIYVQTPEGWKIYPPTAATLGRNIQLWPDEQEPESVTRFFVENANGSRQGGALAIW